jgi:hypothetical protein
MRCQRRRHCSILVRSSLRTAGKATGKWFDAGVLGQARLSGIHLLSPEMVMAIMCEKCEIEREINLTSK